MAHQKDSELLTIIFPTETTTKNKTFQFMHQNFLKQCLPDDWSPKLTQSPNFNDVQSKVLVQKYLSYFLKMCLKQTFHLILSMLNYLKFKRNQSLKIFRGYVSN